MSVAFNVEGEVICELGGDLIEAITIEGDS